MRLRHAVIQTTEVPISVAAFRQVVFVLLLFAFGLREKVSRETHSACLLIWLEANVLQRLPADGARVATVCILSHEKEGYCTKQRR